jgi:site-specific DNA recombinase
MTHATPAPPATPARCPLDFHPAGFFAADEPISVDGMNSTTVLIRRVKQSVAEWYRLQIKEKCWEGMREHAMDGWNIGRPPYGYAADRHPHPNPAKRAQGRIKTRLAIDPVPAAAVAQIFRWRTVAHLGVITITALLNADPAAYPAPDPEAGWTAITVYAILRNPKYTGHQVYNRRRTRGRTQVRVAPDEWLWSPEPTHPAIITRATFDLAQQAAAEHATRRDDIPGDDRDEAGRRTYVFRSRIRCRACRRRMAGATRFSSRYYKPGTPDVPITYYRCPHNPANPRHLAAAPDHPASLVVREDAISAALRQFCDERLFGPDRARLLAASYPAAAADQAARRDRRAATLRKRLDRITASEDAHAAGLLAESQASERAVTALRARTLARLTELQADHDKITAELDALTAPDPSAPATPGNPDLLDLLPRLAGLLDDAPPRLIAQLLDAIDFQGIYNKADNQITLRAAITRSTPDALAALITDSHPGTHGRPPVCGLSALGRMRKNGHDHGNLRSRRPRGRVGRMPRTARSRAARPEPCGPAQSRAAPPGAVRPGGSRAAPARRARGWRQAPASPSTSAAARLLVWAAPKVARYRPAAGRHTGSPISTTTASGRAARIRLATSAAAG